MNNIRLYEIFDPVIKMVLIIIASTVVSLLSLGFLTGPLYGAIQYTISETLISSKGYLFENFIKGFVKILRERFSFTLLWHTFTLIMLLSLVIILNSDNSIIFVNYSWFVVMMMNILLSLYIFPIFLIENLSIRETLKNAILLMYSNFPLSIGLALLTIGTIYILLTTNILISSTALMLYLVIASILLEYFVFKKYRQND